MNEQSAAFELSPRQRSLYEGLLRKDAGLSRMYLGALVVQSQVDNPERLYQAAHSVRELLEKLPRSFDVPIPTGTRVTLKERIRNLAPYWEHAQVNSCKEGSWVGEIDGSLRRFLERASEFFAWFGREHRPRAEEARGFLRASDPATVALPPTIEDLRVTEWKACRDYFTNLAHHRGNADKFNGWFLVIENFLRDRLVPETREDRAILDKIIEEAEGRG